MIAKRLLGIQKAISPPAPAATDVYYDYRSLILNMQGSAGSTTFTDSSPNNLAITAYGNAQLASDATFGTVGTFDGSGDYLSIPSNAAFNFGTGDFTVEFWFYNSNPATQNNCLISLNDNNNFYAGLRVYYNSTNTLDTLVSTTGSSWSVIANNAASNSVTKNTWNHYAIVRSGSLLKTFLNGVQYMADRSITGSVFASSDHLIATVRSGSPTDYFNGLIGPLRISPWAVYKSNFTPSQDLFPAAQDSTYANPYYDKVALQLKFDGTNGSTSFVDSGPNALAVTAVGNAQVSTTQAKYGGASAYFDGAGDAVQIPFNAALDLTSGDFTIEGWVYFNAVSGTPTIITPFGTGTTFGGWVIALDSSSRLTFYLSTAANTWNLATNVLFSATAVVTGTWYHFALVRNGSAFKPYLNGIAGTTFTSSSTLYNNSRPLKIGAEKDSNVLPLNGYIDDLRITKYARYQSSFTPPTQAHPNIYNPYTTLPVSGAALWLDGADSSTLFTDAGVTPVNKSGDLVYQWSDKSGNNRHATQATSGNRPTWTPPASGQNGLGVITFDGSVNYMESTAIKPANNLTIEALFYPSSVSGQWRKVLVLPHSSTSWSAPYYAYQLGLNSGYFHVGFSVSSDYTIGGLNSTSSASANTWYHVIGTFENGVIKLYLNGSLNATLDRSGYSTSILYGTGSKVTFGLDASYFQSEQLQGKLAHAAIYGKTLSSTEVTAAYNFVKSKWGI